MHSAPLLPPLPSTHPILSFPLLLLLSASESSCPPAPTPLLLFFTFHADFLLPLPLHQATAFFLPAPSLPLIPWPTRLLPWASAFSGSRPFPSRLLFFASSSHLVPPPPSLLPLLLVPGCCTGKHCHHLIPRSLGLGHGVDASSRAVFGWRHWQP